ncbi:MAG: peptidylprolyl isomerase [Halothiobacillus sp.]
MPYAHWIKPTAIASAALLAFAGLAGCQDNSHQTTTAAKTPLGLQAPTTIPADNTPKVTSGKVIATINGQPLYEENLKVVQSALPTPMPEQQLVERMVELRLLAGAARQEGLDKEIKTQAQLENAVDNQLANDYLANYLGKMKVTDAELQPEYDKFVKGYPKTTEYKAAHILVKTKEEADAIIKQLDSGTPFTQLAEEKSQDPGSAKQGGDLGWFAPAQMVPEFSAAVEKLKKGEITQQPVKSQFGWHVIKLEDSREAQPPTFAQLKTQLENQYRRTAVENLIKALRAKATVDIVALPTAPKAESPAVATPPVGNAAPAAEATPAPAEPTTKP